MSQITFITGPVRSGKSRRAVELARTWGDQVVFVATYRAGAADPEMDDRVRRHRSERPAAWRTLEAPADVASALEALPLAPAGVLLDCLTLWTSDRLAHTDAAIVAEWEHLLDRFRAAPWPAVIVSNEIGWGPVPPEPALRRFRDLVGTLGQRTAAAASESWLMVAGRAVKIH